MVTSHTYLGNLQQLYWGEGCSPPSPLAALAETLLPWARGTVCHSCCCTPPTTEWRVAAGLWLSWQSKCVVHLDYIPEGWRDRDLNEVSNVICVHTCKNTCTNRHTMPTPHIYPQHMHRHYKHMHIHYTHTHTHIHIHHKFHRHRLSYHHVMREWRLNARTQERCGSLTVHAQTHHAYPTHVMHWNYYVIEMQS